jgi:hypothetical protein
MQRWKATSVCVAMLMAGKLRTGSGPGAAFAPRARDGDQLCSLCPGGGRCLALAFSRLLARRDRKRRRRPFDNPADQLLK